jgi:hypothetical protein
MPEAPKFAPMATSNASFGSGFASGAKVGVDLAKAYKDADASKPKDDPPKASYGPSGGKGGSQGAMDWDKENYARGGRIKRTVGPKVGKDDGLIAAQKGEFVVRKAAVNKLGNKALATINRGKIPATKGKGAR